MSWIFADGHVHIHPGFDKIIFLNSAEHNFRKASTTIGEPEPKTGVLFLTESVSMCEFQKLADMSAAGDQMGPWHLAETGDFEAIRAQKSNTNLSLILIAGRQIVTSENLEVLALGTLARFPEKRPLTETIFAVQNAKGIPVIPWGFGKWMGLRGERIQKLIQSGLTDAFLGDNGGRPAGFSRPRLLTQGEEAGFRILPGTDPLPFPDQVFKSGRFGWYMAGRLDGEMPATSMKLLLKNPLVSLTPYGKLENPMTFLIQQIRMQIRKKWNGAM